MFAATDEFGAILQKKSAQLHTACNHRSVQSLWQHILPCVAMGTQSRLIHSIAAQRKFTVHVGGVCVSSHTHAHTHMKACMHTRTHTSRKTTRHSQNGCAIE